MTKGFHRNKQRNILHGKFKPPKWLIERYGIDGEGGKATSINGVYLDHLEKVADEEDVYECHLYDIEMYTLERLLEGCKRYGIRMTIKAYSEYNPGQTVAIRLEREKAPEPVLCANCQEVIPGRYEKEDDDDVYHCKNCTRLVYGGD